MKILLLPLYEIYWYGFWWLPFIAIAYCATRYLGWLGVLASVLVVSIMIVFIDVHWVFKDMRAHPENGRDADFVFWFGVLCRIVLFNMVLVPVGVAGLRKRARRRRFMNELKVAESCAAAPPPGASPLSSAPIFPHDSKPL